MLRTPIRFPRPQAPRGNSGGPSEVFLYLSEIRKLFTDLTEKLAFVERVHKTWKEIKQGPRGLQGLPGRDGTNVTLEMVENAVRKFLKQPKDGVSPSPEEVAKAMWNQKKFRDLVLGGVRPNVKVTSTTKETLDADLVVDAMMKHFEKIGINFADIKNIEARFGELRHQVATSGGGPMRGGGDTVVAGSGVTITNTVNGNKQIAVTATPPQSWSTPAETPNGVTTVFTVGGSAPIDVVADGIAYYDGAGYTYAAGQITFDSAPNQYVRYR